MKKKYFINVNGHGLEVLASNRTVAIRRAITLYDKTFPTTKPNTYNIYIGGQK